MGKELKKERMKEPITVTLKKNVSTGKGRMTLEKVFGAEGFRKTTLLVLLVTITVLSTVNLVVSSIFLGSFKLHLLTMASNNFIAAPVLMILASAVSIGFSILSVVLIFKTARQVYTAYGAMCTVVFVLELAAVILAFILRNNIDTELNKVNVDRELRLAVTDNSTMETWNILQLRYKCCGGRGNSGYREWENHMSSTYPDSCCTVQYPDCGVQAKRSLDSAFRQSIYERIHVRGCITAIRESMDTYVIPLLISWGIIGVVISFCQLLLLLSSFLFAKHMEKRGLIKRTRHSSTGLIEMEPLKYTSTLNVHLK